MLKAFHYYPDSRTQHITFDLIAIAKRNLSLHCNVVWHVNRLGSQV